MKENNQFKKSMINYRGLKNEAMRIIIKHSNPSLIYESLHCKTQWSKVGVNFLQQELRLDDKNLSNIIQSLVNDRVISTSSRKDGALQVQLQR